MITCWLFHISTLGLSSSENVVIILRTFGRHMATEFSERFFLLIHLRTSQNVSFVRKHLSRQIFDAATLSLGVGESAFAKVWAQKDTHTQHSPQSGRWLFFGSFSMSGYLNCWRNSTMWFFFKIVPIFLEPAIVYSGYWFVVQNSKVPLKKLVI